MGLWSGVVFIPNRCVWVNSALWSGLTSDGTQLGVFHLTNAVFLHWTSWPLLAVGALLTHRPCIFEYAAQLSEMWAVAMYWSSLPSVPMLRALACGIMLPLALPCRPTVGRISFNGCPIHPTWYCYCAHHGCPWQLWFWHGWELSCSISFPVYVHLDICRCRCL